MEDEDNAASGDMNQDKGLDGQRAFTAIVNIHMNADGMAEAEGRANGFR